MLKGRGREGEGEREGGKKEGKKEKESIKITKDESVK